MKQVKIIAKMAFEVVDEEEAGHVWPWFQPPFFFDVAFWRLVFQGRSEGWNSRVQGIWIETFQSPLSAIDCIGSEVLPKKTEKPTP